MANKPKKPLDLSALEARAPDGEGNNLLHTDWGNALTPNRRITPNSYSDGAGAMDPPDTGVTARSVTDAVMDGGATNVPNKAGLNEWFQFLGQFLAHDINQTVGGTTEVFPNMPGVAFGFTRNAFVEINGVRQHIDQETSFLDLSTGYGRSQAMLDLLRANIDDGNGGTIQSAKLAIGPDGLPPTVAQLAANAGVDTATVLSTLGLIAFGPPDNLYAVGDDRANQTPALLATHVVWLREHNWQVDQLAAKHPDWSQDQLFNVARAITEAEWQSVVYHEYLPKLIGDHALKPYRGYNPNVDPSMINEFASVAFRFGHDQSSNLLLTMEESGASAGNFTLAQAFALANAAQALRTNEEVDEWVRGLTSQFTQEMDGKVVDGNRNALFGLGLNIDLMAIDIQRGRDQGTGNYNELREGLGLKAYRSFDEFGRANRLDAGTLTALKDVYGNDIGKLDSLVGGLFEKEHGGGILGETFSIIIARQFTALRDGDRFFYLNQFKDDPSLIERIEAMSMADILERTTGVDHVYHDAFAAHTRMGGTEAGESLTGSNAKDLLIGFGGDDQLRSDKGEDDLYGDAGKDKLYGESGNDHLNGGAGNDSLWGGDGKDVFVFGRGTGRDRIMDFDRKEDRIDLSDYGYSSWRDIKIYRDDHDSIIDLGHGDVIVVVDVKPDKLEASDFILT
jgi:hypothetical protein